MFGTRRTGSLERFKEDSCKIIGVFNNLLLSSQGGVGECYFSSTFTLRGSVRLYKPASSYSTGTLDVRRNVLEEVPFLPRHGLPSSETRRKGWLGRSSLFDTKE